MYSVENFHIWELVCLSWMILGTMLTFFLGFDLSLAVQKASLYCLRGCAPMVRTYSPSAVHWWERPKGTKEDLHMKK